MMTKAIADRVRNFIVENFLFGDTNFDLGNEISLIENGIIDSTGVLELVAFIEDEFGVVFADADIVPANLDTIERIAAFVVERTNATTRRKSA
jgi:acyl carrier protein